MGYVYKITNTVNGKAYIGISVNEPEKDRIQRHLSGRGNRIIARAVKKYGKDVFTYEILEADVFDEFLPDLEVAYIANFNTVAPHGYNLDSGGAGSPSEDTRRKMSEAHKGKKLSEEHRRKLSEAKIGKKRKPRSEAHRRNLSKAHKGKKRKPHSAEHRRKLSEAMKGNRHFYGKRHSAETRRRMSEAQKGKRHSTETRHKLSEINRHADYAPAHDFFYSLPPGMPLREKRKLLYAKFPNVSERTIRSWVRKWSK